MATRDPNLPEGTDTIINGAAADADDIAFQADAALDERSGQESVDFDPAPALEAEVSGESAGSSGGSLREQVGLLRSQAGEKAGELRGRAGDKARDFVEQGKDRAIEALDNVAQAIEDVAEQVSDKVGAEYGDYARRASQAVSSLSTTLRDKDVDDLFDDAREFVRKSPGVALGVAAVVGFALVRLIKSGLPEEGATGAGGSGGAQGGDSGSTRA